MYKRGQSYSKEYVSPACPPSQLLFKPVLKIYFNNLISPMESLGNSERLKKTSPNRLDIKEDTAIS